MTEIEQFATYIIRDACECRSSDVHIVPRKKDAVIQLRIDQELILKRVISKEISERLISHFKFLGGMDIGERRKPQNGALTTSIDHYQVNLRLSTLPTSHDESLVIRLLPHQQSTSLKHLSLFPEHTKKLISLLKFSHGLIIFTGPTGSGKTTTLYTLLHEVKHLFNRNVITLEDPIEKPSETVLQVQVNERAGITYTTGLKAILRHDPDIIMVGEIRDSETAKIAVRAALTGHLVLTTMHTKDTKGSLYRLLEFGVSFQEMEQTLVAVAAQRLVEIRCPLCSGKCHPACKKMRKHRQSSIYELLYGKELSAVMREVKGENADYDYKTLRDVILKGIALGYLYPHSLDGWG
ncbi:competence type IV pilus ATPase ComGA [Priestia aryabhattai]|uniref:Competence type IV pilus ATPase ComGA n=1 Tax=Priestia aryabhattai TaxID=412384 RepID=A0AAX6NA51_PRIAR|nr:competence type IV pilus ATPase ComGA [Priestia aryabhattai]MDU9692803.1 competence type IV pilus ATPase ComGA [Priestia aryabhattai]